MEIVLQKGNMMKDYNDLKEEVKSLKKDLLLRDAQVDQYEDILHRVEEVNEKLKDLWSPLWPKPLTKALARALWSNTKRRCL